MFDVYIVPNSWLYLVCHNFGKTYSTGTDDYAVTDLWDYSRILLYQKIYK